MAVIAACSGQKGGGSGGAGRGGSSAVGGATGTGGAGSGGSSAAGGTTGTGGAGSGGSSTAGGATGTGGDTPSKGGTTGSGGSPVDAPSVPDGSAVCGTAQWTRTSWTAGNDFFRLHAGPDRVFARTWDAINGGRTFLTSDDGATWTQVGSADTSLDFLSVAITKDLVLAATWNDLCQSDSGGTSFSVVAPQGIPADTALWSLASIDATLLAGAREDVYRSSDNGATWTELPSGIPANAIVTSIVASENGIAAGTDGSGVLTLADGDAAWKTGDTTLANAYVNQLVPVGGRLFAVTPDGVFVSSDDGSTWTPDTSGPGNVNCLLALEGRLWAGTDDGGIYVSSDAGGTWAAFSTGMPDGTRVWSLAATSESVFAGTSSGIWRVRCGK